jgi:hypothetical protein
MIIAATAFRSPADSTSWQYRRVIRLFRPMDAPVVLRAYKVLQRFSVSGTVCAYRNSTG